MDLIQYYSDLENLKTTLIDFAVEYPDSYSTVESKAQQTLLKFVQNELKIVELEMTKQLRKR